MIESVSHFLKKIKNIGQEDLFENFFRGHSKSEYKLTPSIYRNKKLISHEDEIFREAIRRCPHEFNGLGSTIEKLVKMQHYGIPTRLLDITSNPLVALYFACCSSPDDEGEVVFLRIPAVSIKFYDSDTVSVLSNIAKRPSIFEIETHSKPSISDFNDTTHISYLHHDIKEEKPYFKEIIKPQDMETVFAVKTKLDNLRILKQNGAFLIFGIQAQKTREAEVPSSWIMNKVDDDLNFKIASNKKDEILEELELLGINESALFPELDYQAKYLKKMFEK